MERRVNVRGIVTDENGRIFAVKHRDHATGEESTFWATPGGGLDNRESLHDGLIREFTEEVGVVPTIGQLLFVHQFIAHHRDGRSTEKLEFFFHVTNTADFQKDIDLSTTSHGYELTRVAFITPSENDLLPAFLQTVGIQHHHIATSQPVLFVNNLNEQ